MLSSRRSGRAWVRIRIYRTESGPGVVSLESLRQDCTRVVSSSTVAGARCRERRYAVSYLYMRMPDSGTGTTARGKVRRRLREVTRLAPALARDSARPPRAAIGVQRPQNHPIISPSRVLRRDRRSQRSMYQPTLQNSNTSPASSRRFILPSLELKWDPRVRSRPQVLRIPCCPHRGPRRTYCRSA